MSEREFLVALLQLRERIHRLEQRVRLEGWFV